jgi:hypothetical protein
MPSPAFDYSSVVIGNKIYLIGGYFLPPNPVTSPSVNKVQIYDCDSDTWSFGEPLPVDLWGASAAATTGTYAPKRIYVFGASTWVYNIEENTWSTGASMPTDRACLGAATVDDAIYVIGGKSRSNQNTYFSTNEKYTTFGYGTITPTSSPNNPNTTQPSTNTETPQPAQTETTVITVGAAVIATVVAVTGITMYHFKHAPSRAAKAA